MAGLLVGSDKVSIGHVIQVKSITFNAKATVTGSATPVFYAIVDASSNYFEKQITVAEGNYVLVLYDLAVNSNLNGGRVWIKLVRGVSGVLHGSDTVLKKGDATGTTNVQEVTLAAGSDMRDGSTQVSGSYLDTGTLNGSMIYKFHWAASDTGYTSYLNYGGTEPDTINSARSVSTLTLMEIQT